MMPRRIIMKALVFGGIVTSAFVLGQYYYLSQLLKPPPRVEIPHISNKLLRAVSPDITLKFEDRAGIVKSGTLKSWVESYKRSYTGRKELRISTAKVSDHVSALSLSFDKDPVNAKFKLEEGRAVEFVPASEGKFVDIETSVGLVLAGFLKGDKEIALTVKYKEPAVTLEKINSLGIVTRLSRGESNFAGSSPARVQNIRVASAKYNGLILKPGEELSFNKMLGPVDGTTGYAAEKVIKGHQLVYEYGGGVCQVSTTIFRAAILAGFPILERKPHSFPVKYYNPQGFDATVYPGSSDLKFINNTQGHILVQTSMIGTNLIFEIYGSDDSRKVTIDGPYQYDENPDGSMKAYFTRTISYDGIEPKIDKFYSRYNSPALYPLARNPLE